MNANNQLVSTIQVNRTGVYCAINYNHVVTTEIVIFFFKLATHLNISPQPSVTIKQGPPLI